MVPTLFDSMRMKSDQAAEEASTRPSSRKPSRNISHPATVLFIPLLHDHMLCEANTLVLPNQTGNSYCFIPSLLFCRTGKMAEISTPTSPSSPLGVRTSFPDAPLLNPPPSSLARVGVGLSVLSHFLTRGMEPIEWSSIIPWQADVGGSWDLTLRRALHKFKEPKEAL